MKVEKSDPTRAGFSAPSSGAAKLSGSEVQDLCLKAARGAGLSWGLAEEAGYAARWLCARGLDGPRALLEHLDSGGALWPTAHLSDGVWQAGQENRLSPIAVGAALSDFAFNSSDEFCATSVHKPLLLLPFAHLSNSASPKCAVVAWEGGSVTLSPDGHITGDVDDLAGLEVADLTITFSEMAEDQAFTISAPITLAQETITRLNVFAMETTVPATDASRADAGSGDGDND